jgi:hypothetical protein
MTWSATPRKSLQGRARRGNSQACVAAPVLGDPHSPGIAQTVRLPNANAVPRSAAASTGAGGRTRLSSQPVVAGL